MPKYPYKFKIKEVNSDPLLTTIEQTGMKAEFRLVDAKVSIDRMKSLKKEAVAQINLEAANMQNVKDNGHCVLSTNELDKFNDDDIKATYIYVNAKVRQKTAEEKLKKIEEGLKLQAEDMDEIFKQTGLKYPEPIDDGKQLS